MKAVRKVTLAEISLKLKESPPKNLVSLLATYRFRNNLLTDYLLSRTVGRMYFACIGRKAHSRKSLEKRETEILLWSNHPYRTATEITDAIAKFDKLMEKA